MTVRIGVAVAGFSTILGSAVGVAQAAPAALVAPPALTLSARSVSASRTIGLDAVQLRAKATYELISHQTRTDPSSTEASESSDGLVTRMTEDPESGGAGEDPPARIILIEVRKKRGGTLARGANAWLTVVR